MRRLFHPTSRRGGFTLVEVAMVLVTFTFIGAMALPRWANSVQHYRADLAAQRIVADLAYAQSRANSTSTPVTLSFDYASTSYQIIGLADPDHASGNYTVYLAREPYLAGLRTINFGGASTLTFDGYGKPGSSGTVVLTVGTWQHTITVDGTSGKAVIQ